MKRDTDTRSDAAEATACETKQQETLLHTGFRSTGQQKHLVEHTDTKTSLKRKRNDGKCEFPGCTQTDLLEWHHYLHTWLGPQPANRSNKCFKRYMAHFQPTANAHKLQAYADELQKTTLLCRKHHTHTHTTYFQEKSRLRKELAAASRLAALAEVERQHGRKIAAKVGVELARLEI